MKKTITILFIIVSTYCQAQITMSSHIITLDNKPVPFVNIYIKNTNIGVISNLDGVFKINIPKKNIAGVLLFSAMGFETLEINISKLSTDNFEIIKLIESTVVLDEVTISTKSKLDANKIVQLAFDNYYKNFPTKPFIAKGFLRHTEKTKKEYKWLVEAAIEIYDPGFDKQSNSIKTNILEIRKSIDDRILDTISIYQFYLREAKDLSFKKVYKDTLKLSELSKGEIKQAIIFHDKRRSNPSYLFTKGLNKLRYYNQKDAIFDKNILKKHTFKIDTIISYGDNDVYKIKITPASPPTKLNKKIGKYLLPIGWIYIRANDYAIMELDYTLINSKKGQFFTEISGSKIRSNFSIKFIEIDNKMYPKYISYKSPKSFNRFYTVLNNLKEGISNSEVYYFEQQEIIFTEIITDKEEIQLRLQKPWNDDLFTPRPYNVEFWKNYNVLLESNEQQKMIQDLEKEVKLKEQFKKNT